MKTLKWVSWSAGALALILSGAVVAQQAPAGVWTGQATVNGQPVPVKLVLRTETKDAVSGSFINAKEVANASNGELKDGHLVLSFDYFARKLEGDLSGDTFSGTFGGPRGGYFPVVLHRGEETAVAGDAAKGVKIDGDWEIAVKSSKGESAWTLRVSPEGSGEIKAVILRIDGDTGGLYGTYNAAAGEYRVGHFGPSGWALYSLKPQADGTLFVENLLQAGSTWTARRPDEARKANLTPPTKETEQTSVLDPSKPLAFSGPDLRGNRITNEDARFKGKVVIVAIGGSWCPNCHDEAPFLVELYKKFHAQGLEIVDLSFEEEAQLKNPTRLKAFQAKYGIPYPILLEGTPDQLAEKLPQGKNLNCWPTAFFIGRDGLVKEVHAGFSGPATGAAYTELKAETETLLHQLLSATPVASGTAGN